jgi:hypothetical protein
MLFGGKPNGGDLYSNETWIWNGSAWSKLT